MNEFLQAILENFGSPPGSEPAQTRPGIQIAQTPGLHGALATSPNPNILGATRSAAPMSAGAAAGDEGGFMAMLQNPAFQDMLKGATQQQQPQLQGGGIGHMDITRLIQAFAAPQVDTSLLGRTR